MLSFRTTLLLAVALLLAHAAAVGLWGRSPAGVLASNVTQFLASGFAATVCFLRARASVGFPRRLWGWFAGSLVFWTVAQLIFTYYESVVSIKPFALSAADIPFLLYYMVLGFALFMTPEDKPGFSWVRTLDLAQVGIVISSVYLYYFFYQALLASGRKELLLALGNVYDILNLAITFGFSVRALFARPLAVRSLYRRLLLYLFVYLVRDSSYTYGIVYWQAETGSFFDLAYNIPFGIAALLAAWEAPSMKETRPLPQFERWANWTFWLPILPSFFVLAVALHIAPQQLGLAATILSASFICSSARLGLTLFRQQRAHELLQASEQRFRSLIEKGSDVIFLFDRNWRVLFVSPSPEKLSGYTADEYLNYAALSRAHPEDAPRVRCEMERLTVNPGSCFTVEYRTQHKAGHWVWIHAVATNLLHDPNVQADVVNLQDITERKQAEQALRDSEQRFRALIEKSYDGIALLDAEGRLVYLKPSAEATSRFSPEEYLGRRAVEHIHPDDAPRVAASLPAPGDSAIIQYRMKRKDAG